MSEAPLAPQPYQNVFEFGRSTTCQGTVASVHTALFGNIEAIGTGVPNAADREVLPAPSPPRRHRYSRYARRLRIKPNWATLERRVRSALPNFSLGILLREDAWMRSMGDLVGDIANSYVRRAIFIDPEVYQRELEAIYARC